MLVSPIETRTVWLLVRTKPKQERLAADFLEQRGIQVYCPRVLEPRTHLRAARNPVPLFPAYLFARCAVEESFSAIGFCPGVSGPVRFGERLAAVDDRDIALLRRREEGKGYLVLSSLRKPPVAGSRVNVVRGPFSGMEGLVEQYLPSQERVRLLLKVVSGSWRAQVDANDVRVA